MGLGQIMGAVVGPDVPVEIEHPRHRRVELQMLSGERVEQLIRPALGCELADTPADRLGDGGTVQPDQPAQIGRVDPGQPSARGSPSRAANAMVSTTARRS